MDNCIVFCSQALNDVPESIAHALGDAFLVAVDGGLMHLEAIGLVPSVWVGDGDSLVKKKAGGKKPKIKPASYLRVKLKENKNYSDLEMALHVAGKAFLDGTWDGNIAILGAQGGRFDHDVVNLLVVEQFLVDLAATVGATNCPNVFSYGNHGTWCASIGFVDFKAASRQLFSVFSFDQQVKISISGAKYNLRSKVLDHASRGLSNLGTGKTVRVSVVGKSPVFVTIPDEAFDDENYRGS